MNESTTKSKSTPFRHKFCLIFLVGSIMLCLIVMILSALSNIILPSHTAETTLLSELDKARLAEAFHLRNELGDALWSGWGQADIPVILYNESHAFLVGSSNPPDGWVRIPGNETLGGPWELVSGDAFNGQDYYWQSLPDPDTTPQSFTVLIGDRWIASLASRDWLEIGLGNEFKNQIPSNLQPVLPYRLAGGIMLKLVGGEDWYVLGILHESFHAYEGINNPPQLYASEEVFNENIDRYPSDSEAFREDWQLELNLLAEAVQTKSDDETIELVHQFLIQRQKRRTTAGLDVNLVTLEKQKEWEEGLAKYTELMMWRLAATTPGYAPLPAISNDPGFKDYAGYQQRWSQEIKQIRRVANESGDGRFYYSGLAQAAILDRLVPDWRTKILTEGAFLEDLLRQTVK